MGSAVKKFLKQQTDLTEIENSYTKGKMLSLGDNGINIGSSYIVIYTHKSIYAIDNNTVQDMTRKMVRVKQYEDNLETQYVAVNCPNCGASNIKIRKTTVGYCDYCGTAIKVDKDGNVAITSGDQSGT